MRLLNAHNLQVLAQSDLTAVRSLSAIVELSGQSLPWLAIFLRRQGQFERLTARFCHYSTSAHANVDLSLLEPSLGAKLTHLRADLTGFVTWDFVPDAKRYPVLLPQDVRISREY